MKLSEQVALLTEEITSLKDQIATLEKEISKIKVETSNFVRAKNIKAATGIKITYDRNGLIETSNSLKVDDLPNIPISKVTALQTFLDHNGKKISNLEKQISILETQKKSEPKPVQNKPITINDIPEIPIEKIKNLKEALDLIKASKEQPKVEETKKILESDIPDVFKNRIKVLEEKISSKAEKQELSEINSSIKSLGQQNTDLVKEITSIQENLKKKDKKQPVDISEIPVSKVKGLSKILSDLPDRVEIIQLNQLIDATNSATASSFNVIREQIKGRASQEQFRTLSNEILLLEKKVNDFINQQ